MIDLNSFCNFKEMFDMRQILSMKPNKTKKMRHVKARALPQALIILIVFQTGPYGNKEDFGL